MILLHFLLCILSWTQFTQAFKLNDPGLVSPRNAADGQTLPHALSLVPRAKLGAFYDVQTAGPMSQEHEGIVRRALDGARALALALLEVPRDSPLYILAFGDPNGEVYDSVTGIARRVANFFNPDPANPDSQLIFFRTPNPTSQGNINTLAWTSTDRRDQIHLSDLFFAQHDEIPVPEREEDFENPRYLNRIVQDWRVATIFRQMIQIAGFNSSQAIDIVTQSAAAGALRDGKPYPLESGPWGSKGGKPYGPFITDFPLNDPKMTMTSANANEQNHDGAVTSGLGAKTRALSVEEVGRLAHMTYGRFMAALNTQTYVMAAIAALLNFSAMVFRPDIPNIPLISTGPIQNSIYNAPVNSTEDSLGLLQQLRNGDLKQGGSLILARITAFTIWLDNPNWNVKQHNIIGQRTTSSPPVTTILT